MRRREFILLLAGVVTTWPLVGHARNSLSGYPDRPITLIVPYAPGGGNDVLARAVAEPMGKSVGQPLVIENRGSAGGSVGTRPEDVCGATMSSSSSRSAMSLRMVAAETPNAWRSTIDFEPTGSRMAT